MAFRGGKRREIKKSSYYVWFLGAKESKGLRGDDYVHPVVRYFVDKEKDMEPMKVTLQLSAKGMKIIQNVPRKSGRGKPEIVKHFIPHHAITFVIQDSKPNDDIVSCILLIYNPITKCPVHVHSYRCDSTETASMLKSQLQLLIDRPENQRKFDEIEARLVAKGLLVSRRPTSNSEGRSTRESDSSGSDRGSQLNTEKIATLYDSLAAELREKLGSKKPSPILLPPRDYDTVHRSKGKLDGIESRKCLSSNIVGSNVVYKAKFQQEDSSGKSSGIGSEDAPSPVHDQELEPRDLDPPSSSDEEWEANRQPEARSEEDLILVQPSWHHHSDRQNHYNSDGNNGDSRYKNNRDLSPVMISPRRNPTERQRSPSPASPQERFQDAREKFMIMDRERAAAERERLLKKKNFHRSASWDLDAELKKTPYKSTEHLEKDERHHKSQELRDAKEEPWGPPPGYSRREEWPKSDRDTGYASRDGLNVREGGNARKEQDPSFRWNKQEEKTQIISPDRGRRHGGFDRSRSHNDQENFPPKTQQYRDHRDLSKDIREADNNFSKNRRGGQDFNRERRMGENIRRNAEDFSKDRRGAGDFSRDRRSADDLNKDRRGTEDYFRDRRIADDFSKDRKGVEDFRRPSREPSFSDRKQVERRHSQDFIMPRVRSSDDNRNGKNYNDERRMYDERVRHDSGDGLKYVPDKRRSLYDMMEEERRRSSNQLASEFKRRSHHDDEDLRRQMEFRTKYRPDDIKRRSHAEGLNERKTPLQRLKSSSSSSCNSFPVETKTFEMENYKELRDSERYPGLDKETARNEVEKEPEDYRRRIPRHSRDFNDSRERVLSPDRRNRVMSPEVRDSRARAKSPELRIPKSRAMSPDSRGQRGTAMTPETRFHRERVMSPEEMKSQVYYRGDKRRQRYSYADPAYIRATAIQNPRLAMHPY